MWAGIYRALISSAVGGHSRRLYLDGQMIINLPNGNVDSFTTSVFLDSEVRQGEGILSQCGIHNAPQNFPTIYVLTPVFNMLNTFLAVPSGQVEAKRNSRLFNIFSVTSGFSIPFNFTFNLNVLNHGRLIVRGSLMRMSSSGDSFRGSLNLEVSPEGHFIPLISSLIGSDGLLQTDNKLDRKIVFQKSGAERVTFEEQTFNLKTEEGRIVAVQLSGSGKAFAREGACLLAENSLLPMGEKFSVDMGAQGYCREDCRPTYGCSLYCVDMPIFSGASSGTHFAIAF